MTRPNDTRTPEEMRAELHRIVDLLSTKQVAFILLLIEAARQSSMRPDLMES
jgi:hypothetical protein